MYFQIQNAIAIFLAVVAADPFGFSFVDTSLERFRNIFAPAETAHGKRVARQTTNPAPIPTQSLADNLRCPATGTSRDNLPLITATGRRRRETVEDYSGLI